MTTIDATSGLYETAVKLTSNNMQGRLSGSIGAKNAANYLADQLNQIGYHPYPGFGSFLVPISVFASRLTGEAKLSAGAEFFQHRTDFAEFNRVSSGGKLEGNLLVIKDGIPFDEDRLKNSIVLIQERPEDFDLEGTVENAVIHGVKALLIEFGEPKYFHKTVFGPSNPSIPVLKVRRSIADNLSAADGATIKIDLPLLNNELPCHNVIGFLPGYKADHTIVVSAHYDHLGNDPGGFRYPGAIDNVSGVTTVLELARKLVDSKLPFNIIIAFFSGEESGLNGAAQFIEQFPEPITAAINIDCIGQETPISLVRVGYEAPSHWLPLAAKKVFDESGVEIKWKEFGREDSVAFRKKGIPALGLGQIPLESKVSIHTPDDQLDSLHFEALALWADLTLQLITELAEDFKGGENHDGLH